MIDTAVILFSTLMCVIVVFRAIKLDGQRPWYGTGKTSQPPSVILQNLAARRFGNSMPDDMDFGPAGDHDVP